VLLIALPCHDEAAVARHAHAWVRLTVVGHHIHTELSSAGHPVCIVALGVNTPTVAVLVVAGPRDGETAVRRHGDGGIGLITRSCGVHTEFASPSHAANIVALSVNAPAVAVLVLALPVDNEAAAGGNCDGRRSLVARSRRTDAELSS